jgi:hypothetical protein
MNEPSSSPRFVLRNLPLAARITLAVFLISVGIGYFSALVQLHFQHASPGSLLPNGEDAVRMFSGSRGEKPKCHITILLEADEKLPWNGSGQMSAAFTTRSEGWKSSIKKRAQQLAGGRRARKADAKLDLAAAEQALRAERDTERLAVLAWIEAGASKEDYTADRFCLPEELAKRPLTKDYRQEENGVASIKIKSVFENRCLRCHAEGGEDAKAAEKRLDSWEKLLPYVTAKSGGGAMSLTKLAQTTHVHLLGFSMLYGLTGLLLALTSYPGIVRLVLAPLPLVAQVVDISFWWLARTEPYGPQFAMGIRYTGMIVAGSLGLQILLTLFHLFGKWGKAVLIALIIGAGAGGYVVKEKVIDPFIAKEAAPVTTPAK